MKMNFDIAPNRWDTDCVKWDAAASTFGMTPGRDILPMWVADMDFSCAPEILEAAASAFKPAALGYRNLSPKFFDSIVGWMQKRHGLTIEREWILPLPGVVSGISSVLGMFTEAGDEVILQTPVYTPFYDVPRGMGRVIVENPLIEHVENGVIRYEMNLEHLREVAARPRAKVMVLCSPHNPIGRLHTEEEIRAVAEICAENGVYLISDEIHSDIMLNGAKFVPTLKATENRTRICQLGSPSKTFNTAGTHSAYMIVPDAEEREKLRHFWSALHIPTESFISSEVVAAAYGPAEYYADELCEYISGNINYLTEFLLRHIPGVRVAKPDATYLLWADFSHCGAAAEDVMRIMCDVGRVAPDPGEWFGERCKGYLRINAAMPRHMIEEAARRMVKAIRG